MTENVSVPLRAVTCFSVLFRMSYRVGKLLSPGSAAGGRPKHFRNFPKTGSLPVSAPFPHPQARCAQMG